MNQVFSSLCKDSTFETELKSDAELNALLNPSFNICFAFAVDDGTCNLVVKVEQGAIRLNPGGTTAFTLFAPEDIWAKYLAKKQSLGFQSFWAIYQPQNQLIPASAWVEGDSLKFAQYAPIWRRTLEVIYERVAGKPEMDEDVDTGGEDHIVGGYIWIDLPSWGGKTKVYYEQSGTGSQDILFMHTAGSDGRQYHGVMNDQRLLARDLRMTVFDLPSHGRSFPPCGSLPGSHFNSEDRYIEVISIVIKTLRLQKTIVCGASMAGLVCLAVALRNAEVGAFATIPVQGCEFVDMERMNWDQHPEVNQSLLVPEYTYGMMCPTAPKRNRHLVWHIYSGQSYRQYAGDLDFYFGGFDYRGKLETIDTAKIPVAMLTGEYDWSCRPEMSLQTAAKIKGAWIKIMDGLGHFPATENPTKFVGFLLQAIDHVNS